MLKPKGEGSQFRGEKDLSAAEKLLIEQATTRGVVDLSGKAVRGRVIKELLSGLPTAVGRTETALKIQNAVVTGGLDFEGCTLVRPLIFERSLIEADDQRCGILLRDSRVKWIGLHTTVVEGDILAERIQVENGIIVTNSEIRGVFAVTGGDFSGTFSLSESRIGDGARGLLAEGIHTRSTLVLKKSKLNGIIVLSRACLDAGIDANETEIVSHGGEWGIEASSAHLGGDFLLEGSRIDGALGISHADINGRLVIDGIKIRSGREIAIQASGINIAHGMSARYALVRGSMDLQSAHIEKGISSPGLEVSGGETAIIAGVATIGGNWDLAGSKLVGDFEMAGAKIAGQLRFTGARLYGSDVAVRADGARIDGGCFMSRAIIIGMLRFPAVKIGNQFRLKGASLKVDYGAALLASGSTFGRDVELNGGMVSAGALVFDQAQIKGTLDLSESRLTSAALSRVALATPPADIAEGEKIAEHDDVVLSLLDSRVNRILMPDREDYRPRGIIVLSRAHVGAYHDFSAAWPPHFDTRSRSTEGLAIDHLVLDGFTYDHLSNPSGAQPSQDGTPPADDRVGARRLTWLAGQKAGDIGKHFKPQPWVQLSSRLAAQGYLDDAKHISITRQRLVLSSSSTSFAQRLQGRILDLFALYGHNPWRTVLWMAFFVVLFAGLWNWASNSCKEKGCYDESVFVVTNKDAYTLGKFSNTYPAFNALGYSFDVFIPFISFGYADHWRPNLSWGPITQFKIPNPMAERMHLENVTTVSAHDRDEDGKNNENLANIHLTKGVVLYILMILEMIIGLTLTSLAITGFTGLLRSD